jgi:hypothetical protein
MKRPLEGPCLTGIGIFVTLFGAPFVQPARAAEEPLLVVVEAPPAVDVDATEIRRAIGVELRSRTIAPMSTPAEAPGRALIVALDRDRIAMSLRANDGASVTRVIPAPAEHAARLRAIAWLAGNLARDQVTPLLAEAPAEPSAPATIAALPASSAVIEPPPLATEPSDKVAPPSNAPLPNGTRLELRSQSERLPSPLRWSVSGSMGPVIADVGHGITWNAFAFRRPSTAWQVTVQRRRERERLVIGGTLEGTYNESGTGEGPQLIGAHVFVGADWHFKYCSLEATLGAGPEGARVTQLAFSTTGSGAWTYSVYHVDLYTQGTGSAAIPLSASLEGLLGLGAHLNAFQDKNWFATATIGLRYKLQ